MSEKGTSKKPFYKKWWFYAIIVFILIGIIGSPSEEERKQIEKEEAAQQAVAKAEKEKKETAKKQKEEEKAKKEAEEKERKANRTIAEKLQEDNENIDKATMKDGILTIEREPGTLWDENSLFHTVYDLFEVIPIAFEDDAVKEVQALVKTQMVDAKGNEEVEDVIEFIYTRETFRELNYDKFAEMAYGQQWRILNESDMYIIHPGIYKNLKEKITENLTNGMSKFPSVE